jgi:Zn finger protein HypA/HybF involved in hydrogenase expression
MVAELKYNPRRQTSIQYYCERCDSDFCLLDSDVCCPTCKSRDLNSLVIIYQEHDSDLDCMYSPVDWRAGD